MANEKNELIGLARCLCGSEKAQLKLSGRSQLSYLTCSACSMQVFARGVRSDEVLRKRLVSAFVSRDVSDEKREEKKEQKREEKKETVAAGDDWDPFK